LRLLLETHGKILYNILHKTKKGELSMPRTLDLPISRCRPSEDIVPFSECRNNLSAYMNRVRETRRPILITQNGRAASYLVDAELLDDLFDQMELSRDIDISRREFAEGKGIPHDEVMRNVNNLLKRWKEENILS
jgi:prevent-host-death family protein